MRLMISIILPVLLIVLAGFAFYASTAAVERAGLEEGLSVTNSKLERAEARLKDLDEHLGRVTADLQASRQREVDALAEMLAPSKENGSPRPPTLDCRRPELTCSLHHVELEMRVVPILYGEPPVGNEALAPRVYGEARQREFPFAMVQVGGGCMVSPPTRALVRSCPECEEAERTWVGAHKQQHQD
jgi:hypothetical protein